MKVRNKLLGREDFSHALKIKLIVVWILFLNSAVVTCRRSLREQHSLKTSSWSKQTKHLGLEDWAGTVSGAAEEVGHGFAALSGGRLGWGESLRLNSRQPVNRHMLPPAKHVEQLLLLAGNPQGAHTKSINCLLRWLHAVVQHLIFHQVRDAKTLGCVAFRKQNLRHLWQSLVLISPVDPNEAIQLKMGFI